jgi:hypothetical protein
MTETERKKKRRRGSILFSSRKQLQRSRMGRRKAKVSGADIFDTARVLSYDASQHDSNDERERRLEIEGDSSVRLFLNDFTLVQSLQFTCLCRTL